LNPSGSSRFAETSLETNAMTTELTMLVWTIVLAIVQIGLFSIARTAQYGAKWNMGARDDKQPPLNPIADRLGRAQTNLYETLPLFIAAVLIAHVAGRENATTALGAQLYFWGRVVYVPLYAFGVPYVRTLVWGVATAGLLMVLWPLIG
jgi:uncharacterized MAPEG superfamily protein